MPMCSTDLPYYTDEFNNFCSIFRSLTLVSRLDSMESLMSTPMEDLDIVSGPFGKASGMEMITDNMNFSRPVEYMDTMCIWSTLHDYDARIFQLFGIFDEYVWLSLLCALIVVTIFHSLLEKSVKKGFT